MLPEPMPPVLTADPITAVGDHTVAATLSLAGGITTMITDITISTATTSAFICFTPAAFTVADSMAAAPTGRDELLLIRKDRGSNLEPRSEAALRLPTRN